MDNTGKELFLKKLVIKTCMCVGILAFSVVLMAQECAHASDKEKQDIKQNIKKNIKEDSSKVSSKELVKQSWKASSTKDIEKLDAIVKQCVSLYSEEAQELQKKLSSFPDKKTAEQYQALNDVGTCLFIQAEAYMNTGKTEKALDAFDYIIREYKWAQAWDPRGWYWSVAEKGQSSVDVITGNVPEDIEPKKTLRTIPKLFTLGQESIIDYSKYGDFYNVGKSNYYYRIKDIDGLKAAIGEGIYPSTSEIYNNPRYKQVKKEGRLEGSHWDFTNSDDLEAAYFKWFTAPEPWGIRMFYIGQIFEKAKMFHEAIRAYHSLIVHYPKTVAWTYWQTPWYPSQVAVFKIRHILRTHPELNLEDKWMKLIIEKSNDNSEDNDVFLTWPGKIVQKGVIQRASEKLKWKEEKTELGKVIKRVGEGKVRLVQYENKHWQMLVNDKPFIIKGMTYEPTKIGQSPDKGTLENWMVEDLNENGKIDGPYEAWVDKNKNNEQDADEPTVGDFQIMKEMGVNTIRFYHDPNTPNKELLRDMHKNYGIGVIMGDFLGKYAIGSGADWSEGTDYENPEHRKSMMAAVKKMVMENKDEPYVLLWLLGNENNYGVACNANTKPKAFFEFANEVAKWIKSVDPDHPVAISNGDTLFLDIFGEVAPDIDIFTANVYRGDFGFGSFWQQVADASGKPAFITEYGAPAYAAHLSEDEANDAQAEYHEGNWVDIVENSAGSAQGMGNSIGGVAFEWLDEWWKNYEPYMHDKTSDAIGPFPGGYYFEEWFGLVSQGNGKHSPYMRQLRPVYDMYKDYWNR
ncbi:MAG: tetratricopeptide (TPR) repeat protein [Candidatus Omnitrophota bacterium]